MPVKLLVFFILLSTLVGFILIYIACKLHQDKRHAKLYLWVSSPIAIIVFIWSVFPHINTEENSFVLSNNAALIHVTTLDKTLTLPINCDLDSFGLKNCTSLILYTEESEINVEPNRNIRSLDVYAHNTNDSNIPVDEFKLSMSITKEGRIYVGYMENSVFRSNVKAGNIENYKLPIEGKSDILISITDHQNKTVVYEINPLE